MLKPTAHGVSLASTNLEQVETRERETDREKERESGREKGRERE